MHPIALAFSLTAASFIASPAAQAACHGPVGGSENSTGITYYEARARAAYFNSNEAHGRESFLLANGFCPVTTIAKTKLLASQCSGGDSGGCKVKYEITRKFIQDGYAARTVRAVYNLDDTNHMGEGMIKVDGISLDGLGVKVDLATATSDLLIDAMSNAGVTPDNPHIVGALNLFSARLHCSAAVVPNPIPGCSLLVHGDTWLNIDDQDANAAFYQTLVDLGASDPILIGASNFSVALVSCTRVVVPTAHARCTAVVEAND